MNILEHLEIHAGGPGSGCRGENCGRKAETGKPYDRVLYRGVSKSTPVDEGMYGKGEYWTSDKDYAQNYAEGGALKAAQVHLNNPYVTVRNHVEYEVVPGYRNKEYQRTKNERVVNELVSRKIREVLHARGHDGIIMKYGPPEDEDRYHEVVIFRPDRSVRVL